MSRCPQPTWLFDLDNTLHDASVHIFPHINQAMTDYIGAALDVDASEAARLRQHYWQRYGATLHGLVRHHGIDPRHFLHNTHQIPDLARRVVAKRGLAAMLRRLPGRKIVFSNAPFEYTVAVLEIIGITRCFSAVYSVERLRFQAKPAIGGFLRLLRNEALSANACILVEDTLANLKTAKKLGMRTVWVSSCTRRPPYVDVRLASLLDLPGRLGNGPHAAPLT